MQHWRSVRNWPDMFCLCTCSRCGATVFSSCFNSHVGRTLHESKGQEFFQLRFSCFAINSQSFLSFHCFCRWDTLTGNLELVEQVDGHSDIVYGSFDPKYFKRSESEPYFWTFLVKSLVKICTWMVWLTSWTWMPRVSHLSFYESHMMYDLRNSESGF